MIRFAVILFAGLLLLPVAVTPALAKVDSSAARVHVVKSGDSLYGISQKYGLTVKDLQQLNGLNGNNLKIGQKLALNRAAAPPLPKTAKPAADQHTASSGKANRAVHVVKKGENLGAIARRYGVTVEKLKQLNQLHNNNLQVGQQLAIESPAPQRAQASAPKRAASDIHVVKQGETLGSIARRHHLSIKELKQLNGLRSDRLKVGQRLALADPAAERSPLLLPGDASEDEVLQLAYSAESALEQAAFNFLSTPYRFGGNSRKGIDCSAFVQQVFREVDVDLPRSAREQFRVGAEVDRDELEPGDLIFFRTYAKFPSHVGIYLGDNKMIHASSRSRRVVVTSLDLPYYQKRFIGAKRITLLDQELPVDGSEELLLEGGDEFDDLGDEEEIGDLLLSAEQSDAPLAGNTPNQPRRTVSTSPGESAPIN
jgi:LysM repeat protein